MRRAMFAGLALAGLMGGAVAGTMVEYKGKCMAFDPHGKVLAKAVCSISVGAMGAAAVGIRYFVQFPGGPGSIDVVVTDRRVTINGQEAVHLKSPAGSIGLRTSDRAKLIFESPPKGLEM